MAGLKNVFGLLALFWPFCAEIGSCSYQGTYCYFIFFGNTFGKVFVTNAISDARILILVIFEG